MKGSKGMQGERGAEKGQKGRIGDQGMYVYVHVVEFVSITALWYIAFIVAGCCSMLLQCPNEVISVYKAQGARVLSVCSTIYLCAF